MPSKIYKEKLSMVTPGKLYTLEEAVKLVQTMPKAKFDESLDLSFKLGIDPRKSDQAVRGAITLPHGSGKKVRCVVICDPDKAAAAKAEGAETVGFEDVIEQISKGWLDFDVMIATPAAMNKIRPLGKVLGPRGLMPNPKTGTVTDDVAQAVKEAKLGRVEYRSDKTGCIQVPTGKVSFTAGNLVDNCRAVIGAVKGAKPDSVKGDYLVTCTVSSTMGPGVKVDLKAL